MTLSGSHSGCRYVDQQNGKIPFCKHVLLQTIKGGKKRKRENSNVDMSEELRNQPREYPVLNEEKFGQEIKVVLDYNPKCKINICESMPT